MVEIGTHPAIERAEVVTLDLMVRATQFYPNQFRKWLGFFHADLMIDAFMEQISVGAPPVGAL
jgi:hypothetical protein